LSRQLAPRLTLTFLQQSDVALSEDTRSGRRKGVVKPWITEIASLMDSSQPIHFVPGNDGESPSGKDCSEHQYLPTKQQWALSDSRNICVQLDGRYMAHRKNPTEAERKRLESGLEREGFLVKHIGLPMSLAECVAALSQCYCFVGVDSGMMHVANSVRCPRILIRNRMYGLESIYHGKSLLMTRNADSALALLV